MTSEKLQGLLQVNELSFTEEEASRMTALFETMYQKEKNMLQYDTDNVEVMVHVMPMTNVLREDIRKQTFSRDSLLKGAPEHTEDSWQVPRLVK